MKKNKMMRIASVLLVAVLLSTCAISGTFAKYVTQNSGSDQASVAKFGVTITVADDMGMFETGYATEDNLYAGDLSVKSNATVGDNTDNRVAPGTKGQMSFSITGTPEVATRLTVSVTGTAIQLAAGTYNLAAGTFDNEAASVTTTAVYEPIKFYFGTEAIDGDTEYTLTLADLEAGLEALTVDNDPNATLDKTYYIGWCWAIENTFTAGAFAAEPYAGAKVVDFLDTYLGNEATAQKEILDISIRVEQID